MKAFKDNDSFFSINMITNHLKRKISKKTISDLLSNHPFFNGMRAISDTLDKLGVENGVFTISKDQIVKLDTPFIAHMNVNGGEFIWVERINNNSIDIVLKDYKALSVEKDVFLSNWTGNALFFNDESSIKKVEKNYTFKNILYWLNNNFLLFSIATCIILFVLNVLVKDYSLELIVVLIIKLIGITVSVGIIYKTYYKSDFLKRICKIGKKIDCNSILNSNAAKIFGISLGELGLMYFILTLGITYISVKISAFLILCSSFAFLITLYTLAYQAFYAKKWCVVCLMLTLAIWIEFSYLLLIVKNFSISLVYGDLTIFIIGSGIVFILLLNLHKLVIQNLKLSSFKEKAKIFYTIPDILELVLQHTPKLIIPDELNPIKNYSIRNKNRSVSLITSLSCNACAKTFLEVESMLNERDDINISVVFYVNRKDKELFELAHHIIEIYNTNGWDKARTALSVWYSNKYTSVKAWKKNFGIENVIMNKSIVMDQMEWCITNQIDVFPKIIVDKNVLPNCYDIKGY